MQSQQPFSQSWPFEKSFTGKKLPYRVVLRDGLSHPYVVFPTPDSQHDDKNLEQSFGFEMMLTDELLEATNVSDRSLDLALARVAG